jgi:hypothetical protein
MDGWVGLFPAVICGIENHGFGMDGWMVELFVNSTKYEPST